jgi:hypothetical protein
LIQLSAQRISFIQNKADESTKKIDKVVQGALVSKDESIQTNSDIYTQRSCIKINQDLIRINQQLVAAFVGNF